MSEQNKKVNIVVGRVVSNKMGNIPARQMNAQHYRTPGSSHPATFYFKS